VTADAADAALRRFERDAVVSCVVMAAVACALVAPWWGVAAAARAALGVLGGGLLTAVSYRAIKGAANLLVETARQAGLKPRSTDGAGETAGQAALTPRSTVENPGTGGAGLQACPPPVLSFGRRAFLCVKFFTRYALLAVAAYVMLTRLRLHPVAVLAGATSPFLAALMQVVRMPRASRPHS
jgi:hypothetical protein